MNLYTECFWPDWDRIVEIYVDKTNTIPDYINDAKTYKIMVLEKGQLELKSTDSTEIIKAPMCLLLSEGEGIYFENKKSVQVTVVYFNPMVIRDEFETERINSCEFDKMLGQAIYQDYCMVIPFGKKRSINERKFELSFNSLGKINGLINIISKELKEQKDGFWPCRSRSYLMELLYYINYTYIISDNNEKGMEEEFSVVREYLNEHINEDISLERVTGEFSINRNKLNDMFMKETGMTCLNYLTKMRMDLATIMLTRTELPIGEVGARVGYTDSNYFTKVFKQSTGQTPSSFRKEAR